MEALCVINTVMGIIVDEENGSGVRHDNHTVPANGVDRGFAGTLS